MKEEVFTGNVDDLLEHVINNTLGLSDAADAEALVELKEELDAMIEEGVIELVDGKYRLLDE